MTFDTIRRIQQVVILLLIAATATGCASLQNTRGTQQLDSSLVAYAYSDDLQNTFVRKTKNGVRMCSQADPDAAQSFSAGLNLAAGEMRSASIGAGDSVVGSGLGGRNPEVLILRELMFRACELASNYDVDYQEARSLYTEFLKAALIASKTQRGDGSQAIAGSIATSSPSSSRDRDDDDDDDNE